MRRRTSRWQPPDWFRRLYGTIPRSWHSVCLTPVLHAVQRPTSMELARGEAARYSREMDPTMAMAEATHDDRLTTTLLHVVSDPTKLGSLYEILGDFCHQCRNSLNTLKLSMYLAKRGSSELGGLDWGEFEARYHQVESTYHRLQTICRPMAIRPMKASLALVMEAHGPAWRTAMAKRGRELTLTQTSPHDVGEFDPNLLPQGLDTLIQWRAEAGAPGEPATLQWAVRGDRFQVDWHEPTVAGFNQTDAYPDHPHAFALPLLARIVAAHGGLVSLDTHHGLHLGAEWPVTALSTV